MISLLMTSLNWNSQSYRVILKRAKYCVLRFVLLTYLSKMWKWILTNHSPVKFALLPVSSAWIEYFYVINTTGDKYNYHNVEMRAFLISYKWYVYAAQDDSILLLFWQTLLTNSVRPPGSLEDSQACSTSSVEVQNEKESGKVLFR